MPNHNDTPISLKKEIACVQQTTRFGTELISASAAGAGRVWASPGGPRGQAEFAVAVSGALALLQIGSQEVSV